jgi:hypothetical protein
LKYILSIFSQTVGRFAFIVGTLLGKRSLAVSEMVTSKFYWPKLGVYSYVITVICFFR